MRICKFQSLKGNDYQQMLQKWLQAEYTKSKKKKKKEKFCPTIIMVKLNYQFSVFSFFSSLVSIFQIIQLVVCKNIKKN